ncbi:MAG: hypothetical protein ABII10_00755, partial [Candidatus Paceibacterota bacterium]
MVNTESEFGSTLSRLDNLELRLGVPPLKETEESIIQTLFVTGHILPGVDLSAQNIMEFMKDLGPVIGMSTFYGPIVKTPDSYDEETRVRLGGRPPEDVNAILMWDDSGSQMYIFPNRNNWFTISVYTCKSFDREKVLDYIYKKLHLREDMRFAEQIQTGNNQVGWQDYFTEEKKNLLPEQQIYDQLAEILETNVSDPKALIKAGLDLEQIVFQSIKEGWDGRLGAVFNGEYTERFQGIHGQAEIAIDKQFTKEVLAGKITDPDDYPLQKMYDRLASMESVAANMQPGEQIIHIGTGCFPGTAFGLSKLGIPVLCIEKDPAIAKISIEVLRKLNLLGKDKLSIASIDG